MDSGIDVPSSSAPVQNIDITERSSSIGDPSSSPLPILPVGRDDRRGRTSASARRSYSPSSSVSFDQGFAADAITEDEREEFAAQQAQRQERRWRSVVEEQDEGQELWDLEKRLDSWVGKCPLCYVRQCGGRDVDVRHSLDQCPDALRKAVATDITRFEKVWFEKFTSCTDCRVAQKICTRWQETYEGSCRFKPVPGRDASTRRSYSRRSRP